MEIKLKEWWWFRPFLNQFKKISSVGVIANVKFWSTKVNFREVKENLFQIMRHQPQRKVIVGCLLQKLNFLSACNRAVWFACFIQPERFFVIAATTKDKTKHDKVNEKIWQTPNNNNPPFPQPRHPLKLFSTCKTSKKMASFLLLSCSPSEGLI